RLLLFKWLMVLIPPLTVTASHNLPRHLLGHSENTLAETVLGTMLALTLAYLFAETMFAVLRKLQAEVVHRQQDILTMNAVMQERERLSRELHDGAAQLVAHLLLRLDTIKELVEVNRSQEARAELERLHDVANEIYEDVGESIAGLRTDVTERGVISAVQDYVDQFEERHHIPVSFRADTVADRLSPLAALQLFRLIQEALTNVRKHAAAEKASVTLASDGPDQLRVIIADDGQGFILGSPNVGKVQSLGLTSMRERVESLGGSFQVLSQSGEGTRVMATFPLPPTRNENDHAALADSPG
ncbi:MAG: hypothetical protein AVDCRST_MAG93-789, partial [uncultured Chloroflexia bacterium]